MAFGLLSSQCCQICMQFPQAPLLRGTLVEHSELQPNFSAIFIKDYFPNTFPPQLIHLQMKCKQFWGCAYIPDLPLFRLVILLRDARNSAVRLLSWAGPLQVRDHAHQKAWVVLSTLKQKCSPWLVSDVTFGWLFFAWVQKILIFLFFFFLFASAIPRKTCCTVQRTASLLPPKCSWLHKLEK